MVRAGAMDGMGVCAVQRERAWHWVFCGVLVLGCVAMGCSKKEEEKAKAPETVKVEARFLRGEIKLRGDERSFVPCAGVEVMWVSDGSVEKLGEIYRALAADVGEGVYVEVRGEEAPGALSGPGIRYARQLEVEKLIRAESAGLGCAQDLRQFEFRASGNEPFWRVEVATKGILFTTPENMKGVEFPYSAAEKVGGARVFRWKREGAGPGELELRLEPGECVDTMSGAYNSWKAEVKVDGKVMTGCAAQGL